VRQSFVVNLKKLLVGEETKPVYLKPNDIVYVPERFSPFWGGRIPGRFGRGLTWPANRP